MARLNWTLGFGRGESGEIVVVRDDMDASWTRAGLDAAIANYQATAEYTVEQECIADLVRDGEVVGSRRFVCPGRGR